jgi:hypothetical protein
MAELSNVIGAIPVLAPTCTEPRFRVEG